MNRLAPILGLRPLAPFLLAAALILLGACDDTTERNMCSAPTDCVDGFDCIEGECRAVEDDCDCRMGFEECVDGVCEQVEVVNASITHEDQVTGRGLDGAAITICTYQPVRDETDVETLLRDDECSAVQVGPNWQPSHEPIEADLGTITLSVDGGEPIEVPKNDSEFDFLRGCYTTQEQLDDNAPVFRPGDQIEMAISGSADFPQLAFDATVPEAVEPVTRDFAVGEPLTVTWQPAAEADPTDFDAMFLGITRRLEDGSVGPIHIGCRAADDGEFTIPAKFTSLVSAEAGEFTLHVARSHTALLNHEDSTRPLFVEVRAEVDDFPLYSE